MGLILFCVQNKGKRADDKEPGADGLKEDPSSPDTGQQESAGVQCDTGSPANGAGAALHTNNNTTSSYNLVSSLLNLTKSPVSRDLCHFRVCVLVLIMGGVRSVCVWVCVWACFMCVFLFPTGCPCGGKSVRGSDAAGQLTRARGG